MMDRSKFTKGLINYFTERDYISSINFKQSIVWIIGSVQKISSSWSM